MNSTAIQHILVEAALDLLPPQMRRSLLDDKSFLERWDIATAIGVTLGKGGPSFQRDHLYDGIRAAIREIGKPIPTTDSESAIWNIVALSEDGALAFSIERADKRFSIMDHSALSDEPPIRVAWFERTVREINLNGAIFDKWQRRIGGAALSDDEFAELAAEMEMTPVNAYRNLQMSMARVSADTQTLVPQETRYYQHLVGVCDQASDVTRYIESDVHPLITQLLNWNPVQGFLFSLLTCSVGSISEIIQLDRLKSDEMIRAYEWLVGQGDPISQMGAVEIALRHLDIYPGLEPFVERMVEGFIGADPDENGGSFALLSAMIVVVASELARRQTLGDAPPYYRRQAAIAQASLIVRAIFGSQVDPASVTEWAQKSGLGHIFFLQGLIDLRSEPRWLPDFVGADQLRAEFIGRVSNAAEQNKDKVRSESLRSLLLGPDSKLASAARWPFPLLPGPMEGANRPSRKIPDEVLKEVTAALEAERLELNSFAGLVNTALLFDLSEDHSELAATALRRVRYSIENAEDEGKVFGLIGGLAIVAAVTRSTELANELRILARVMRRKKRLTAEPDDEMRIAMNAAASHESIEDWARFAGEWITEIAFEATDEEASRQFLPKLRRLMALEPALVRHCAAAEAALTSYSH